MSKLFSTEDYRAYLKDWIASKPGKGRGMISAFALELRCQPAYVSRILQGKAQLSSEQAFALQKFLGHTRLEAQYFMLLLDFDRAGSHELKAFYRARLEEFRSQSADLNKRFSEARSLDREQQQIYYSSAHYAMIHVCISVPMLQKVEALEKYVKMPRSRLLSILAFLKDTGLAYEENGRWKVGQTQLLHLSRGSPWIRQHHSNWRVESMKSLDRGEGAEGLDDLHYSGVVSLSKEDAIRLREHWVNALEKFSADVASSPEETVRAIVIDFFSLGNS